MSDYRIVNTFRMATEKEKALSGGKSQFTTKTIPAKKTLSIRPIDISSSLREYQPVDVFGRYSENRGMMWGKITLEAGDVWEDWDGQRLVIEATHRRVIYLKHGGTGAGHIFLQSPKHFITNVAVDTMNRKAAQKTAITKRFAEWEMHFVTGFLGAAHWVGLVSVFGMDIFQQVVGERKRNGAYRESSKDIIEVDQELKAISPVFRQKLLEILIGGIKSKPGEKAKTFIQTLPADMIKDDKTTGRIAGAIAAKFIVNPANKNLAFYFVFQTITTQIATKSITKIPGALGHTLSESFKKLVPNVKDLDPANPKDRQVLLNHLVDSFKQLGVNVTPTEAQSIYEEIRLNPIRIAANLAKLGFAFERFGSAGDA